MSSATTHLHVRVDGREALFGTALGELGVGSGRSCLIRVGRPLVAERHLVLRPAAGGWRAQADGQPVFLDGEPVGEVLVDRPLELRRATRRPAPCSRSRPLPSPPAT